ncbi:2-dehydropantoate 2-reductase [Shewanella yunxiaonensis]|uniref:2-dehydropantoate 2-reductase n=1 Tax=Shewanella yunxiaonensis TaxID=2829809 RepID=A0ABX7YR67_9GAMM|nr:MULTISPECIES: 2-dehydropantoate 2-reductase [Shewanella]MDF0533827.1 2-dehydropantoate 2-reductase [Shewanella sp. A32]QUN05018.1 2-dehydropantoate 2-reductase [Shewanella yunxiaonensis]
MRIAILGAGAIGQLLAHQLADCGEFPLLLVRPEHTPCRGQDTYHIESDQQRRAHTFQWLSTTADNQAFSEIELLIVTLKAYQVPTVLPELLPKLPLSCHVLLLHNGLGSHSKIIPLLNGRGLSLGTTSQGALRQTPQQIRHTGKGLTQFGPIAGPMMSAPLKLLLLKAIPDSEWCDDILQALWEKLAVNAAINPLTAIDNVPNGTLAAERYQQTIKMVINELVSIAHLEGISLHCDKLLLRVNKVIELTAKNYSSMQQDLQHGRPTEIDAINGYLVQLAQQHGIEAPMNQLLTQKIKQLSHLADAL